MSFIYVIAASEQGPVKLGISKTPDKRVRQLQTGNAESLNLYHSEEVDDECALNAERNLHRILGHYRLKGEWFNLSVEDAIMETIHIRMTNGSISRL